MNSNNKFPVSGDFTAKKANGKDVVSSGEPVKQAVQTSVSLSHPPSPAVDSSAETTKHRGGSGVSSAKVDDVLFFKDVKLGPQEGELRFRLIHYWKARNAFSKTLIGYCDPRIHPTEKDDTYLPHMMAGSIYRLNRFYGSKSKNVFRVADPDMTMSFTWNSVLSPLENSPVQFPEDRFRFYGHEEFEAACDLRGAVYGEFSLDFVFDTDLDFVGHIKLVNEQVLNDGIVLDEGDKASTRRVLVHVQTHDGPVMKLNLWDKAATDFYEKFKAHGNTPSVILVTTVNPKRFGDEDHVIPVPQDLIGTIGQTHKFVIKVSKHNLESKTQALTVTKVLTPDAPVLEDNVEENVDDEPGDERKEVTDE
ncbi:hypothetical protein F2Q70_00015075 [Brassica cretica]|uniref:DUF223 domain-containing protein n=1 Tax=Brassica cretica TaxID=69181 RepID=A0A8S9I1U0_BRACR|nr:hypothetical protein F2Q70_00015075 [Brassica cretica]